MTLFADASAVVKLYADEAGSARVRELGTMYVAAITRVEVPSALWCKHRLGGLSSSSAAALCRWFEDDLHASDGRLAPAALDQRQLDHAAQLLVQHDVRAADAIQLAASLAVRRADPTCSRFACFDTNLAAAAEAEGFDLA